MATAAETQHLASQPPEQEPEVLAGKGPGCPEPPETSPGPKAGPPRHTTSSPPGPHGRLDFPGENRVLRTEEPPDLVPVWSPRRGWIRALGAVPGKPWVLLGAVWGQRAGVCLRPVAAGGGFSRHASRLQGTRTYSRRPRHERETERPGRALPSGVLTRGLRCPDGRLSLALGPCSPRG